MEDVYKENGFDNRNDYLAFLAQDYGMSFDEVFHLANLLGENEDFDGLLSALKMNVIWGTKMRIRIK